MKTPEAVAQRLLGALEILAARESLSLEAGDGCAAAAAAARAAPLAARLATLDSGSFGPATAARLSLWREWRSRNRARTAARMAFLSAEIGRLGAARRRLQEFAPVYGSSRAGRSPRGRLNAAV